MKPGEGRTYFYLDKPGEIRAIEAGIFWAGLRNTDFDWQLREEAYKTTFSSDGEYSFPQRVRNDQPEFPVTVENVGKVRAAAEATIAKKSLMAFITGRRRTAKKILKRISAGI